MCMINTIFPTMKKLKVLLSNQAIHIHTSIISVVLFALILFHLVYVEFQRARKINLVNVDDKYLKNVTKLVYKDNLISSVYNLSRN